MGNVFRTKLTPNLPTTVYLGLSSTEPSVDGSGVTEPSSVDGYERVALSSLSEPENGVIQNESEISFPESTANWGTMTHFVIYDAKTDGNLLMYENLSQSRNVEAATIVMVKTGSLKLTLANPS